MHIYQPEINDGLQDIIKASTSISYASLASPSDKSNINVKNIKSLASIQDGDLYYVQSILVSSTWNKNDDIFDKEEVWLARKTPEDKPTNLDHNESLIIGHITSNWPVTEDGILIDENTPIENLPEKYHILTGSVIYTAFSNPELRDRSQQLISEIESENKFVSMECLFRGFDYGVLNKANNEYKVLARNDSTAYLTKHLRAYGGSGEHENYKIGRVLRNITFSGKGFVDKPANPDSIIFTKNQLSKEVANEQKKELEEEKIKIFSNIGVFNDQLTNNMENNNMNVEQQLAEIKETLANMQACAEATQAAQSTITELEAKVAALESELAAKAEELSTLKSNNETLASETEAVVKKAKEEKDSKEEEFKNMKASLEAANETIAAYKNKEVEMAKKEKKMKRVATLIEAGVDNDTAIATVDQLDSLDDDSFDSVAKLLAAKKSAKDMSDKEMKDEEMKDEEMAAKKSSKANTDTAILDTVEVENEADLSVSSTESTTATDHVQSELVEFISNRLGKK
jgi:hypothetical protein